MFRFLVFRRSARLPFFPPDFVEVGFFEKLNVLRSDLDGLEISGNDQFAKPGTAYANEFRRLVCR